MCVRTIFSVSCRCSSRCGSEQRLAASMLAFSGAISPTQSPQLSLLHCSQQMCMEGRVPMAETGASSLPRAALRRCTSQWQGGGWPRLSLFMQCLWSCQAGCRIPRVNTSHDCRRRPLHGLLGTCSVLRVFAFCLKRKVLEQTLYEMFFPERLALGRPGRFMSALERM